MGARLKQAPDGYDVVKVNALGGRYMVLLFERDERGNLVDMAWLGNETNAAPLLYAKRATAINAAILHQLTTEKERLQAELHRVMMSQTPDTRLAVGVS